MLRDRLCYLYLIPIIHPIGANFLYNSSNSGLDSVVFLCYKTLKNMVLLRKNNDGFVVDVQGAYFDYVAI